MQISFLKLNITMKDSERAFKSFKNIKIYVTFFYKQAFLKVAECAAQA